MKLENKTILISGGTSGIGIELARALRLKQNKVLVLGSNSDNLALAENEGFETVQCDLGNQASIEQAARHIAQKYPDLNVLFNNAGIQLNYDFCSALMPLDKVWTEIHVNLSGQILLTQLLIPVLASSPSALIVNTTSGLGAFPKSNALVYSASKAGMRNFTAGLRRELRQTGIKVLEFMPPVTQTPMTRGREGAMMAPEILVQKVLPQIEKGRVLVTVPKMRVFLLIAYLIPKMAAAIIENKS